MQRCKTKNADTLLLSFFEVFFSSNGQLTYHIYTRTTKIDWFCIQKETTVYAKEQQANDTITITLEKDRATCSEQIHLSKF